MRFEFDWDPAKAEGNRRKHGVTFEDAMGCLPTPWRCPGSMMNLAKGRSDRLP
jgi:uncharacterized DUF497 family protein